METGVTILKILERRVPFEPTSVVLVGGEVLRVSSLSGVGRDVGSEFDRFWINADRPDCQPLFTNDVTQILDAETGATVFDAFGK